MTPPKPEIAQALGTKRPAAYAAENLMLLSLSHEEYLNWASVLKNLDHDNPILTEDVKSVNEQVEQFVEWAPNNAMAWEQFFQFRS